MGHKLKGTAESYATRHYEMLAPEFFKVNFDLPKEYWKQKFLREREERLNLTEVEPTEMPTTVEAPVQEGWQSPKMENQTLPYEGPTPNAVIPKETVTISKTVTTMQKTREVPRVYKPAPTRCLRHKVFDYRATDEFCHTFCVKQQPNTYKNCQELQEEFPKQFT